MADEIVKTPYATAMPFIKDVGTTWAGEYDAQRISTYDLYDDLYNNDPSTFRLLLRGTNELPIFVPTAKKIITTLARYVGKGWGFSVTGSGATPEDEPDPELIAEAEEAFGTLFKRERMLTKFASGKKEWLRRGDWIWMITADPLKDEGRRISIDLVDPRNYFPIEDEDNLNRLDGCEVIEEFLMDDNETVALRVQQYMKPTHPEYNLSWGADIAYSDILYSMEDFTDPDKRKTLKVSVPLGPLTGITSVPVYHIKNNEESQNPFGKSELAGLETIIAGINQSVSDEDLALALSGLGMYKTNSERPTDEEGNEENWILGPNRVVEVSSSNQGEQDVFFDRIDGVSSVEPSQTHVKYLQDAANGVTGISDVALGVSTTQESGIALIMRLSPLLDAADEKDLSITDVMNQLLFDLKQWFDVYEGQDFTTLEVISVMDKSARIPFDRDAYIKELLALFDAGIVSLEFVQNELKDKLGYKFDAEELSRTKEDAARKATIADPLAQRSATELNADDNAEETE